MIRSRALVSLLVAFMLALSSVAMAGMSFGAGTGGTLVELCGSDLTVQVDLPGGGPMNPMPDRSCPICLAHQATDLIDPVAGPAAPARFSMVRVAIKPDVAALAPVSHGPQVRAPPVLI